MCTNGINATQLEMLIDQADDHVALEYRWAHKLAHVAEDAGYRAAGAKLHEAQHLLADARALLDEAKDLVEAGADEGGAAGAHVHLV